MPNFEMVAKGDSNPGSLDCESGVLPLSYRAPHDCCNRLGTHSFSPGGRSDISKNTESVM